MRVKELVAFIKEREAIRIKKESGQQRPWTRDPILDRYRFCNVHREDDFVTRWLRANWYAHFESDQDVWFAAVMARLLNQPDALYVALPFTLPWSPKKFRYILHERKAEGLRNFNAAYIVSTNGVAMDKVDYLVERVLNPLWAARKGVYGMRPLAEMALYQYHIKLMKFDGLGSFIAAQVVADLKYMEPLKSASDWWAFAASGPGSRRGLNRVLGRDVNAPWREEDWRETLLKLRYEVNLRFKKWSEDLHAQDLQNCLCEFDKYERARLGEGTPKQIYKERV